MAARTISSMYLLYEKNAAKVKVDYFRNKHDETSSHINKNLLQTAFFLQIYISLKGVFSMLR